MHPYLMPTRTSALPAKPGPPLGDRTAPRVRRIFLSATLVPRLTRQENTSNHHHVSRKDISMAAV